MMFIVDRGSLDAHRYQSECSDSPLVTCGVVSGVVVSQYIQRNPSHTFSLTGAFEFLLLRKASGQESEFHAWTSSSEVLVKREKSKEKTRVWKAHGR